MNSEWTLINKKPFLRSVVDALSHLTASTIRIIRPDLRRLGQLVRLTLLRVKLPGLPLDVQIDGSVEVIGSAQVHMGHTCRISRDVEFGTEESGRITLGDRVRINRGTTLFSYTEIRIGDDSLIGEFVTIRDANHGTDKDVNIREQAHDSKAIHIGSDVWIGRGSVILPGVTIGDHSVIGANSVVTRSIEENAIALGSPARVIRKRS